MYIYFISKLSTYSKYVAWNVNYVLQLWIMCTNNRYVKNTEYQSPKVIFEKQSPEL